MLKNWNVMRVIRLGLGVIIIVQAVMVKDITLGLMGIFFASMPLFNIGCCGVGGCDMPVNKNEETKKEISYEEVVESK